MIPGCRGADRGAERSPIHPFVSRARGSAEKKCTFFVRARGSADKKRAFLVRARCSANEKRSFVLRARGSADKKRALLVRARCSANEKRSFVLRARCSANKKRAFFVRARGSANKKREFFLRARGPEDLRRCPEDLRRGPEDHPPPCPDDAHGPGNGSSPAQPVKASQAPAPACGTAMPGPRRTNRTWRRYHLDAVRRKRDGVTFRKTPSQFKVT